MKTSVTKIMMSFALMGCLIIGASDASAQGRSRSQGGSSSSRSQSAAVSRSSSNSAPTVSRSASPSVSRSTSAPRVDRSSSVSSSRSTSAPQVDRSSSISSSRSTSTPRVDRSSSISSSRSASTPQVTQRSSGSSRSNDAGTRVNRGATTRGGNSSKSIVTTPSSNTRPNDNAMGKKENVTKSDRSATVAPASIEGRHSGNSKPNGNRGGHIKPNGNKGGTDKQGGMDRPNGNNGGMDRPNSNRPGGRRHRDDGRQGERSFDPSHRYDYNHHHYSTEFRWNYSHHNWSRPLPPPARAHRPAPLMWRRPVIPAGWRPYASAPVIDRILGIMFGTLYEASLEHLYYNGYYIDGYADNIIYLRDVSMINLYWPDVMLSYEYGKLANAQFIYHSSYYDRARFDRAYRSLCRIYGPPVFQDGMTISWYGGNNTGWVTLTMSDSYGEYYTTMSIGY